MVVMFECCSGCGSLLKIKLGTRYDGLEDWS